VKPRTRQTKVAGARNAGLALAFKLVLCAQDRWRRVNAPHLVAMVRAGVEFKKGKQVVSYEDMDMPSAQVEDPVRIAA